MLLHIGLDIGSTTAKLAAYTTGGQLVYRKYARHYSDIKNTTVQMLKELEAQYPGAAVTAGIAGSAGLALSQHTESAFIQEVIACSETVSHFIPEADVVIELGGEDAKIIYLTDGLEQRMNAACAGGTGAFIDQIAALLQTDASGLNELAKGYATLYPIASRCGVFAKTDVQPLLNEGARREDIAASVFQSVVTQTVAGLACGRPIRGRVAFLGGPLTYLSELRARFMDTLHLDETTAIFPDNSLYYVAIGAARLAKDRSSVSLTELIGRIAGFRSNGTSDGAPAVMPRLFADAEELEAFRTRHRRASIVRGELGSYRGALFLGIDAGSTTTKMVLAGTEGQLLYSFYKNNRGNPLESVLEGIRSMYAELPEQTYIARSAVTGYGEGLIQAALQVDEGEIETVAHYKAALAFSPEVDFILDIGGQDMKCIKIREGAIEKLILNEACSAGCGSFLESFANSMNLSIEQFAESALLADQPADLGSRCTVFMNSKVKQVQKEGVSASNLAAGLSYSVVKNAIQKVMRLRNTEELGEHIIVQGGTFYNEAVLRAFELSVGREVVRPDIAGMMGAYGCALIARERDTGGRSSILPREELDSFRYTVSHSRCRLCGNACSLTINRFNGERSFVTGNRCERGAGHRRERNGLPNLYQYKYERIFSYESLTEQQAERGTVGIPRVLNMYENYPFWHAFFTALKFRVVLSPPSSKRLFERGMESIPSESVCYPAKLTHGHVASLAEERVDFIFYPSIVFERKETEEAANHYNCPVVASYPEVIRVNMDELVTRSIPYVQPFLTLDHPKALKKELAAQFPAIPRREISQAVDRAFQESDRVKEDIRRQGEETLRYLRQTGKKGIVLAGRPYHIDPEVHHGIPELINSLDMAVLTEDSIAHMSMEEKDMRVVNQWTYHSRLYRAARVVRDEPALELVQLNSFGCGLDAITADMVQEILEARHKLYTIIKIDEIHNLGAARIRLRSLQAAMRERSRMAPRAPSGNEARSPVRFTKDMRKSYTILIPQMSPIHFSLYETVFNSEGYRAEVLPEVHQGSVDDGLRYVNNDACYPAILTIGQLVHALKSGNYDVNRTAVMMTQTGGSCRATNYIALLRKALLDAGMEQVPVLSLNALGLEKHPGFELSFSLLRKLIAATCYGDALMRAGNRIRPYEEVKGSTDRLLQTWIGTCRGSLARFRFGEYKRYLAQIIQEFDTLQIKPRTIPRVGVVGEILVKFHPDANNRIVRFIEQEGAEAVLPDLLDFFLYCAYDRVTNGSYLGKSRWSTSIGHGIIHFLEVFRQPLKDALARSSRFKSPVSIYEMASKATKLLSVANQAGEGWFLTAEMMELIEGGVDNIACVQPFACLPNHVTGRGMLKGLKKLYPGANITAIDYDASETEVNQINRLKLLLATAFKNMERAEAEVY